MTRRRGDAYELSMWEFDTILKRYPSATIPSYIFDDNDKSKL